MPKSFKTTAWKIHFGLSLFIWYYAWLSTWLWYVNFLIDEDNQLIISISYSLSFFFQIFTLIFLKSEEMGLHFPLWPFFLIIGSVGLTALYYRKFHQGGILNANGPNFCPKDETEACCVCKTLICVKIWSCICCAKNKPYVKMEKIEFCQPSYTTQNGHLEIPMNTYSVAEENGE